jgi:hypothetical protein
LAKASVDCVTGWSHGESVPFDKEELERLQAMLISDVQCQVEV